ncbi:MAG: hypothetical protein RRZ68_07750, partial [Oscillospiraceae bacterium]
MLYREFLNSIEREHTQGTTYAYKVINNLYMENRLKTHEDCYNFFNKNKNDFLWVDELILGKGKKAVKPDNLTEEITDERAIEIINGEYGFERDKIEICATPYFDAWDF